jgi:hypothetical protein
MPAQISQIRTVADDAAGSKPAAQNGGYRTSVLSRPSRRVTVIAVTGQSVMPTAHVAVTADRNSAAKLTAVLIKRCGHVLTERCRYITN